MTNRGCSPVSGVFEAERAISTHPGARADASATRLRGIVESRYDFVWRTLRFHGVPEAGVEDAAQQVFCVVARRLGEIAEGAELSFLFVTASRVASEVRRASRRRPESSERDADAIESPLPSPEELVDERRARNVLQEIIEAMQENLRAVFVLFEIEELTIPVIASVLGIPEGTATSRLRRAREEFQSIVKRRNAAQGRASRGART